MTEKTTTSPALYSKIRDGYLLGAQSFTRQELVSLFHEFKKDYDKMPQVKSFLDWLRRNKHITSDGDVFHWTEPGGPEDADDLAEDHFNYREGMDPEEMVVVTDTDPENPMILPDAELAQDIRDAADMRPENLYVIVDVKRLSRKKKKRMKRELLAGTSAKKVTLGFLPQGA